MSLEILMEQFMVAGLRMEVGRRDFPLSVGAVVRAERELIDLDSHELKLINYKVELREHVEPLYVTNKARISKMGPGGSLDDLAQLAKYYPLYRAVSDKFDVPWYAVWLTHARESTCSKDNSAFGRGRLVFGAVQRTVSYYPDSQAEEAAGGLERFNTKDLEQPTDVRELAWFGWKIDQDARATINADRKPRFQCVIDAIGRFSPDGAARQELVDILHGIFG